MTPTETSDFTLDAMASFAPARGSASSDNPTLHQGDCLEILQTIGKVDAVITDPPYNVGLKYGGDVDDNKADYAEWCAKWFGMLQAERIAISCGIANAAMWTNIKPPTWWLCWHKPGAMGRCVVGFNNWEAIALWGKPLKQTSDVITAPIVTDATIEGHPCPKPLNWAKKQIEMLVPEGGIVLDPFAGTGTVLLAAKEMNRRAIGIEINPKYCAMINQRLAQGWML